MKLLYLDLIGQYKGLVDQRFDLRGAPGPIIAFIGMNGSGKSQLMELLAEVFAYLERAQRKDFRVRHTLGFEFCIAFAWRERNQGVAKRYKVVSHRGATTVSFSSADQSGDGEPPEDSWTPEESCLFEALPLPRLIGYASGLNENLQRPFMRNAVQYFDVMTVRARRRFELSMPQVDEDKVLEINLRYRQKHGGIFGAVADLDPDDPLKTDESDTQLPAGVFLDYDCTNLVVMCLGLLPKTLRDELWPEVPFRHPSKALLRYDLRRVPFEQDTIQDIEQLVRTLGNACLTPRSARTRAIDLERYGLDYLAADITIDFQDPATLQRLRDTYPQPARLFWKLYKLQLLGVKHWAPDVRKSLRDDRFQGHVKKPLKGRLPLSAAELWLSDGDRFASIDDLSDGEAQLLHTLGAVRLFSEEQALFILDEPETHLNPSWRTRYHLDLEKASQALGTSQALVSSHSPFLISSLRREAVCHFEKVNDCTVMETPAEETFGASFEVLIKKFFGMNTAISQTAVDEITHHLHCAGLNRAAQREWIEQRLGESLEKVYLLKKLEA
jgi:predicted ATPase